MGWLGDIYQKSKKKISDTLQPVEQKVSSGLGAMAQGIKNNASSAKNYFSQPETVAKDFFMNTTPIGAADKLMNNKLSPFRNYFKPTEKVRMRDVFREAPNAVWEGGVKPLAQGATRFAISAGEAFNPKKPFSASGKYYNTPFGKLNSFQSEAQNRVQRGDPLWKAIGNPAMDTFMGAGDIAGAAKPLLGAAKSLSKFGSVGKEISHVAEDLNKPLGRTM